MVAGSFTLEFDSSVEARRLWNATVKDSDNLLRKHASEKVAGVKLLQGDGGVGSIRQVDFTPAHKDFSYWKSKVDLVDEPNMVYGVSHVEGGLLGTKLASSKFLLKISPKAGGGSTMTITSNYDTLPGVPEDEAKLEQVKTNSTGLFKLVEEYLVANPTLYC